MEGKTGTPEAHCATHTLTQLGSAWAPGFAGRAAHPATSCTGALSTPAHTAQRARPDRAHLTAYIDNSQRARLCILIFIPIHTGPRTHISTGSAPPPSRPIDSLRTHSMQLCMHSHRTPQHACPDRDRGYNSTLHASLSSTTQEASQSQPGIRIRTVLCSGARPLPTASFPAPRAAPEPAATWSGPGTDRTAGAPWPAAFAARPLPPPRSLARWLARSLPIWEGGRGAGGGGRRRGGAGRVTCERRVRRRWKGERHGARNKRVGVGKSRPSRRGSGRSVRAPAAPRLRAPASDPGAAPVRPLAPAARAHPGPPRRLRVRAMHH